MDPLAGSPWSAPATVGGFAASPPNPQLLAFAARQAGGAGDLAVDIGCGAARNAVPLAAAGWRVLGVDLSRPMLDAAVARAAHDGVAGALDVVMAAADRLPVAGEVAGLVVAHGIWNLLPTGAAFRRAIAEAARVARPGAGLFVFTFSRHTVPADAAPVAGETFVFTEFSGRPQCFLTDAQLVDELGAAGFVPDPRTPLVEHNRTTRTLAGGPPVIWEGGFLRR